MDAQVDCYSYGVLLWELVTKQLPQRGSMRDVLPHECVSKPMRSSMYQGYNDNG